MSEKQGTELQVKEKKEVAMPAEQTRPGMTFVPDVDIYETEKEITLLADIPGVASDNLSIDLKNDTLTLVGDVDLSENKGEEDVYVEYETGKYQRQFTISQVIDQSKIEAELKDGILRLTLPKIEKATPRKITVNA